MVRLLIFLAALALVAAGLTWLANNPGVVDVTWRGEQYEVSLLFALGAVLALGIAIAIVWGLLRFVFRIPSLVSVGAQSRRREKGFQALVARHARRRRGRRARGGQARLRREPADRARADGEAPASAIRATGGRSGERCRGLQRHARS